MTISLLPALWNVTQLTNLATTPPPLGDFSNGNFSLQLSSPPFPALGNHQQKCTYNQYPCHPPLPTIGNYYQHINPPFPALGNNHHECPYNQHPCHPSLPTIGNYFLNYSQIAAFTTFGELPNSYYQHASSTLNNEREPCREWE